MLENPEITRKNRKKLLVKFDALRQRLHNLNRLSKINGSDEVKIFFQNEEQAAKNKLKKLSEQLVEMLDFRLPFFTVEQAAKIKKRIETAQEILYFEVGITELFEVQVVSTKLSTTSPVHVFAETTHNPVSGELEIWSMPEYPEAGKYLLEACDFFGFTQKKKDRNVEI